MIAGKIIPAIATSTALIVGLNGMEIIRKLVETPFTLRRDWFFNLSSNYFTCTIPYEAIVYQDSKPGEIDPVVLGPVKYFPKNCTNWDFKHFYAPVTL